MNCDEARDLLLTSEPLPWARRQALEAHNEPSAHADTLLLVHLEPQPQRAMMVALPRFLSTQTTDAAPGRLDTALAQAAQDGIAEDKGSHSEKNRYAGGAHERRRNACQRTECSFNRSKGNFMHRTILLGSRMIVPS